MLSISFAGWFQCRLATNPDPTDEPRGVSGYTFALGDEPDLDRIIRFQRPVAPRSHGPSVGVHVTEIRVDGTTTPDHPLADGRVALLDDARFESRNRVLSDDKAGTGPIHPFHLSIRAERAAIKRRDLLVASDPDCGLISAPLQALNRRAPEQLDGFRLDLEEVRSRTGMEEPRAVRRRRCDLLLQDLKETTDPLSASVLRKRIEELEIEDEMDLRILMMRATQTRKMALRGPTAVHDPDGSFRHAIDSNADWPLRLWMGGWDADALCGFVDGSVHIPPAPRE